MALITAGQWSRPIRTSSTRWTYNLIENAVKFCNEHGYIEVSYRADDAIPMWALKTVAMGSPRDEIPHIFDRFYKTDNQSRSREKGGAGLELHIVRSIVNLHGGDIVVRSVEGNTVNLFSRFQSRRREEGAAGDCRQQWEKM